MLNWLFNNRLETPMSIHSFDGSCVALQISGLRAYESDQAKNQRLEVSVVFTNKPGTLAALHLASQLAMKLEARFRLVMPYEVHYALPLTQPAVPVEFLERELRALAGQASMEIAAQIFLCRDKQRLLKTVLRPGSLVIVGGRKRWWPTPEQELAQALTRGGHQVIFAEVR
jgi:hypothetical protein